VARTHEIKPTQKKVDLQKIKKEKTVVRVEPEKVKPQQPVVAERKVVAEKEPPKQRTDVVKNALPETPRQSVREAATAANKVAAPVLNPTTPSFATEKTVGRPNPKDNRGEQGGPGNLRTGSPLRGTGTP